MNVTTQHMTGFAVGVATTAVVLYAYKQNQDKVDDFLRRQGIQVPERGMPDPARMTLEELVAEKERLEDIIAERELGTQQETPA